MTTPLPPIPEDFNQYPTPEERQEQWEAFNRIRTMFNIPKHLSWKDAQYLIDRALKNSLNID